MDACDEGFRLSTGTTFYVPGHVLGIDEGEAYGGWQQELDPHDFSGAERVEIALYAMRQWMRWASMDREGACPCAGWEQGDTRSHTP